MRTDVSISNLSMSNSSAISIVQDLMEGLGWNNMSSSIYQADAEQDQAEQKLANALQSYSQEQNSHTRSQLITVLNETLQATHAEYDHAIKQLQYHQKQAAIEAEQKTTGKPGYLSQWSYWIFSGVKNFFSSTTEQQIEKYQDLATKYQATIEKLSSTLSALQVRDEESDNHVETHHSENNSLAHFPPVFNLSTLNSQTGFKMRRTLRGTALISVSAIGDSNGDGYDDIIIGFPIDDNSFSSCFVVFGRPNIGDLNFLNLTTLNGTDGFIINGNYMDFAGWSVGGEGDINGNGLADLAIGSPNGYTFGHYNGYIIFGSPEFRSFPLRLSNLSGTNSIKFLGEDIATGDYSHCGEAVRIIDDINGDKYNEFVIGAPYYPPKGNSKDGRTYLVFGQSNLSSIADQGVIYLGKLNGTYGFKLNGESNTTSGFSISGLGDVDGDGHSDFIIGAPSYSSSPEKLFPKALGGAYVILKTPSVDQNGFFNLSDLNGNYGFKIINDVDVTNYCYIGSSISSAGDVNGDGYADIIIGTNNDNCSYAYVVLGGFNIGQKNQLYLSHLNGTNGFKIQGEFGSYLGFAISSADFNGDDYTDLILGTNSPGDTYILFGSSNIGKEGIITLTNLDGVTGFKIQAEISGFAVSNAGDINVDGVSDILIVDNRYSQIYAVFGDIPPQLVNNSLSLDRCQKITLNSINLAAFDKNHNNDSLIFVPTNVLHGYFQDINQPNIPLSNFTQQQVRKQQILFVHDGSLDAPTYEMIVRSPGIGWAGPSVAAINFNSMPIILVNNQLAVNQSQTVKLTTNNLLAICNISNSNLTFMITNITHGFFTVEDISMHSSVVNFSQQAVFAQKISFTQDGSPYTPTYYVSVNDSWIQTPPIFANITFNPIPMVLVRNQLIVNQTQTVLISTENLLAVRNNISDPDFVFIISNITHGMFFTEKHVQQLQTINFTQQEIFDEAVFFNQDGSPYTPEYQVSVSDDWNQTKPASAKVIFNVVPFNLVNNQLTIKQNESILLTSKELLVTRSGYADPNFKLVITNISHGFFVVNQQKSSSQITFPQQDILSENVNFTQDGSKNFPTYWVAVNNGWNQTDPQKGNITFFAKPVFSINQFLVALDQSILLSLNNLCANDCYSDDADELQFNLLGNVTGGQFENNSIPGKAITSFAQKNIKKNQIKFVSNGMPEAPRYQLTVTDPTSQLFDSSDGSTLLVTKNYLPINQNQIFYLTAENLNVTSSIGSATDIIFSPVTSTLQHGYFSLVSDIRAPVPTFKQDQVIKNQLAFVPDGSSNEPSCILSVRDSQPEGASGSFPCQIDFASYPRLDHAFLKISPPDSFPLTVNNLEASDDRVPPEQLYFMVTDIKNDHFAYSNNFNRPIMNFSQAEISAGKVYFIATTNQPPAFSVTVWNGRLYCQEDCPRTATVVAPDVDEGGINSLLIGLLSSFGTLVLLPLLKWYVEKAIKSYFSSREDTPDSQVTNEALAQLWIGCCGVITHRQHEAFVVAFGHVVDRLNDSKQSIPLREKWHSLSDRQKGEIKSILAEKSKEVLVGEQSRFCRFFKSFCSSEATPEMVEQKAEQIANRAAPRLFQLFSPPGRTIPLSSFADSSPTTPLLIGN